LPAIEGYVPQDMVRALQAFLEFCYITQRDIHDANSLQELEDALEHYHTYHQIFQNCGAWTDSFNLPQQHSRLHYLQLIRAFSAPNGLCSSITESKLVLPWLQPSAGNPVIAIIDYGFP
jgi:hypothetical protein